MKNIHVLPKQEQTKCYCGHTSYCDCGPEEPKKEIKFEDVFNDEKKEGLKEFIDNHKQETLEEAAKEFFRKFKHTHSPVNYHLALVEFAKWQLERSYSEEDMREAFIAGGNSQIEEDDAYGNAYFEYMEEWFEQFKKK